MKRSTWLVAAMMTAPIALTGCLGGGTSSSDSGSDGGSDGGSGGGDNTTTSTLSGTTKDSSGGSGSSLVAGPTATFDGDPALSNAIALAVAADGSTKQTQVAPDGSFSLDLADSKKWGLVILNTDINRGSLGEPLGYLDTTGSGDDRVSEIQLGGSDTSLGNVGVNPDTQTAEPSDNSQAVQDGKVQADRDGDFEKNEKEGSLEASKPDSGGDGGDGDSGGESVSMVNFMGKADRWMVRRQVENESDGGDDGGDTQATSGGAFFRLTHLQSEQISEGPPNGNGGNLSGPGVTFSNIALGFKGSQQSAFQKWNSKKGVYLVNGGTLAPPQDTSKAPNKVTESFRQQVFYDQQNDKVWLRFERGGSWAVSFPNNFTAGKTIDNIGGGAGGGLQAQTALRTVSLSSGESVELVEFDLQTSSGGEPQGPPPSVYFLRNYGMIEGVPLTPKHFDDDSTNTNKSAKDVLQDHLRFGRYSTDNNGNPTVDEHAFSAALNDSSHSAFPDGVKTPNGTAASTVRNGWLKYMENKKADLLKDYEFDPESPNEDAQTYTSLHYEHSGGSPATPTSYDESAGEGRGLRTGGTYDISVDIDEDAHVNSSDDKVDSAKLGFRINGDFRDTAAEPIKSELNKILTTDGGGTVSASPNVPTKATLKSLVSAEQKNANGNLYTWPNAKFWDPAKKSQINGPTDVKAAYGQLVVRYTYTPKGGSSQKTKTSVVTEYGLMRPTSSSSGLVAGN